MTIAEDYFKYTNKWRDIYGDKTIVLLQVGGFYEVYALGDSDGKLIGSKIEEFTRMNDLIIGKKNIRMNGPIDGVTREHRTYNVYISGFNITQLDRYLDKMQGNGYTIAVYNQDTPGKNSTRSLSEIISPGTHFNTVQYLTF